MRALIVLIFLAVAWSEAQAARVIKVGNNQEYLITSLDSGWRVNDSVCLFDTAREVACGVIAQMTDDKIGIKLTLVQGTLRTGQALSLRRDARVPASTQGTTTEDVLPPNPHHTLDIAGGLSAGFNYYYPMLHFQMALGDAFSLGVMPLYFSSTEYAGKISGAGGFVTLNYYYTHFPFRGFFFQGGAGFLLHEC